MLTHVGRLLLLVVVAMALASPARAADPLTLAYVLCEPGGSSTVPGQGYAGCISEVVGGVPGYTYTWTQRKLGYPATTTWMTTEGSTVFRCSLWAVYDITLTVSDRTGATTSKSSRFECTDIAP